MQQERAGGCKKERERNKNSFSWLLITFSGQKNLPVYLSLLVDDAMGFFSGYSAMEPQLSYMDDCIEFRHVENKTLKPTNLLVLLPQIYLSLMKSGEVDCGSLKCSIVDSSSERDVKKDEKTVINTRQCSLKLSFLAKKVFSSSSEW